MLSIVDYIIIVGFLLLSLAIGLYYRKGAGKSVSDFFLGGRNLPWYVAGLSMVATTFAADTPLAVSELVSQGGIAKNWLWWSFLFGGALTTFFFATLWRRSGVLTELEFITLRYSGQPAKWLRMFKSVYLGLILNAAIIGWVNIAMTSLLEVFFGLEHSIALWYTFGMMLLAVVYATISGLKGVAITDTVQFVVAMVGCIILAVLVLESSEVGGMAALKERLPEGATDFFPRLGASTSTINGFGLTIGAFLSFVAIQWWSSWYPGSEPGGGGYVAQRMMSTRSERDSVWATLLFQIGHYCIRPWPWIVVGLCAMALYDPALNNPALEASLQDFATADGATAEAFLSLHPEFAGAADQVQYYFTPRLGFIFSMRDFLPTGLMGLLLTAFIAAYLSTISTQVNWGASYLVNDLLIPLRSRRNAEADSQSSLVRWSRITSLFVMIAGAAVTPFINNISAVWEFIMQCGAGLGLVLILRWYWWRINAWSEITATIAPLLAYGLFWYFQDDFSETFRAQSGGFYFTVAFTTVSWLVVTFLTAPPETAFIAAFDQRVRPMGWWPVPEIKERNQGLKWMFGGWVSMTATVVSALFFIGSLVLLNWQESVIYGLILIIAAIALNLFLKKTNIFDRNSKIS